MTFDLDAIKKEVARLRDALQLAHKLLEAREP